MTQQKTTIGLDLGTATTCAVVLDTSGGTARVLGAGIAASAGVRKGIVVDIAQAAESVRAAVRDAEASSGTRITRVTAGATGSHVACSGSYGVVGVAGRAVTAQDRQKAVDAAGIMHVPIEREILHRIPNEFVLDGQDSIRNPVGMPAVRLEARILVVTAAACEIQKLAAACEAAGLALARTVFSPLASAAAVLSERERNEGAVLVDIGAGTTGIAVFRDGEPRHAAVIGVGGANMTHDLAIGLRIPAAEAEQLKLRQVTLDAPRKGTGPTARLKAGAEEREVPAHDLLAIAVPRCLEMAELIRKELTGVNRTEGQFSLVLTGGASLLPGFAGMAGKILGLPVRIGSPLMIQGLKHEARTPAFSAAIGLALAGRNEAAASVQEAADSGALTGLRSAAQRMTGLFRNLNLDKNKKGVRYV